MHNRAMSDSIDKRSGSGCTKDNCVCLRNQDELTQLLMEHADPHIRILAHISARQLAMVESNNDINKTLQTVIGALNSLRSKVETGFRELNERVDVLAEAHSVIETRFTEFENELPTGSIPPT